MTGDSSEEGNSEEEGLEAVDAGIKDSEKKSNVSDSEDIISDKGEFESIRTEIRKLRRRQENEKNTPQLQASDDEAEEFSLTGIALARIVRRKMRRYQLNPVTCVGIGCDSCSVNVSESVGAVVEI